MNIVVLSSFVFRLYGHSLIARIGFSSAARMLCHSTVSVEKSSTAAIAAAKIHTERPMR